MKILGGAYHADAGEVTLFGATGSPSRTRSTPSAPGSA
jgi:hypothetical protein